MKHLKLIVITTFVILAYNSCAKGDGANIGNQQSGAGGSTAMMTLSGNYLYIVDGASLQTYDISQPGNTVLLNKQNVGWNIETIFPYRDKLFIGSQTGMFVYDNSNPKNPKLQGQAQHFRACDPVVADDSYAFVTLRSNNITCGGTTNQLNIYDIQGVNILTPKLVGFLQMRQPHGLGYKENTLYVCMGTAGLNVIDISDKTKPGVIKTISTDEDFIDVIPYGDLLITYIKGGIILYDISNATNPKKLSSIISPVL